MPTTVTAVATGIAQDTAALLGSTASALPTVGREALQAGLKAAATLALPLPVGVTDIGVAVATEVPVNQALSTLDAGIIDPQHPVSAVSLLRDTARENAHALQTSAETVKEQADRDARRPCADPGGGLNHHPRRRDLFGL